MPWDQLVNNCCVYNKALANISLPHLLLFIVLVNQWDQKQYTPNSEPTSCMQQILSVSCVGLCCFSVFPDSYFAGKRYFFLLLLLPLLLNTTVPCCLFSNASRCHWRRSGFTKNRIAAKHKFWRISSFCFSPFFGNEAFSPEWIN